MNPTLHHAVWQQLLDAERCSRYYLELAGRYRKWQMVPRVIMAISAFVGSFSILMKDMIWVTGFPYLSIVLFLLMIAAVVWDLLYDHGKKAAIVSAIGVECGELKTELKDLWRSVCATSPVDEKRIGSRLKEIEKSIDRVTMRAEHAGIQIDEKLNEKVQEEGFKVVSDQFKNIETT